MSKNMQRLDCNVSNGIDHCLAKSHSRHIELYSALGITRQRYYALRRQERCTVDMLTKIADFFKMTMNEFLKLCNKNNE